MVSAWRLLLIMICCCLAGCSHFRMSQPGSDIKTAAHDPDQKSVYVVGHGWHTGLALRTRDISAELWPEVRNFQKHDIVEIGWGDEGFYRAKKITLPLVLDAALLPSGTVMHVAGMDGRITQIFPASDIVEVPLTDSQFDDLSRSIAASFQRDEKTNSAEWLGPGLYGDSQFFRAKGLYYFPKTCNVWTATQLHAAGCPVLLPSLASSAEGVLTRTRRIGKVVQESPSGIKLALLRGE